MKIVIIGPVQPFRSGIARYTTALAREFDGRKGVDVTVVSFARQYPRMLYPGADDRDRSHRSPEDLDTVFILDSVNPATWRRAVRHILQNRPDLAIMPAWTFFLAPCLGFVARALRRNGIPVAMIVHNAEDHESAAWKQSLNSFQLRQADRFLAHNTSTASELIRRLPETPVLVHPHPVFEDYPEPVGKLERRAALELLIFGVVRPYKGVDIALRALAASGLGDVRLSIVGEFWSALADTEKLVGELELTDKVEIVPRYVSDREAAEFFGRSDAVIMPYRSTTGSGVLALAQLYGRPVVASDLPGFAEAISHDETGWLFRVGDEASLADLLRGRVTADRAYELRPNVLVSRRRFSWKELADALTRQPRNPAES